MAAKKGGKTSKTEHVLNLLAGAEPAPAQAENPASAGAECPVQPPRQGQALSRPLAPPVLEVARANQQALSETIHHALEDALAQELVPPEPPTAEPAPASAEPEDAPAPAEPEPLPASAQAEDTPAAAGAQTPPAPARREEAPPPGWGPIPLPDGSQLINVMALLVEDKLERYVKLFGLCACPRCLADAKALALSSLRAKYVVLPQAAAAPMLELYRGRYDVEVTTQVVAACKAVMEAPRHTLPEAPTP